MSRRLAGRCLYSVTAGSAPVSNNLLVGGGKRLLIQASHAYEHSKANVLHWRLDESARTVGSGRVYRRGLVESRRAADLVGP